MRTIMIGLTSLTLASLAGAQTAIWSNADGGIWSDPTNWSGGALPARGDSVLFDLDGEIAVEFDWFDGFVFEGRRLAVTRGDVLLMRGPSDGSAGASFNETELANPPAILIGSYLGGEATLTTDVSLSNTFTLVAPAGAARVATSRVWSADDFVIGGATENTAAFGAFSLDGPSALLQGRSRDEVGNATIGFGGHGQLTLRDGAIARVGTLRLAAEPSSRSEIILEGDASELTVDELFHGEGEAHVLIGPGGVLRVHDAVSPGLFGSLRLEAAGGRIEVAENLVSDAPSVDVEVRSGGSVSVGEYASVRSLMVSGSESVFTAPSIKAPGALSIRDGGRVTLGGEGASRFIFGPTEIDGGTLIVEEPSPFEYFMFLGGSFREPAQRVQIGGGATVAVEGQLMLSFSEPASISGAGTSVRQRVQTTSQGPFGGSTVESGHMIILGLQAISVDQFPRMDIVDGAVVDATLLQLAASIHVQNATLEAADWALLDRGALSVGAGGRVAASRLAIGRVGYGVQEPMLNVRMSGFGIVAADVSNGGVIDPGSMSARGTLRIDGELNQRDHDIFFPSWFSGSSDNDIIAGVLDIDIASADDFDRLDVTGDALLGGTLRIELDEGFAPAWGDVATFLTAGAIDGAFDSLELPDAPPGLFYEVEYTDTSASLVLHNEIDLSRDFRIDGADLSLLLGSWGPIIDTPGQTPDLNRDGVVDGADLGVLLGAWGASAN